MNSARLYDGNSKLVRQVANPGWFLKHTGHTQISRSPFLAPDNLRDVFGMGSLSGMFE